MAVNPLAIGGGVVVAAAAIGGGIYAAGALSSSAPKRSWYSLLEDSNYYQTPSGTTKAVNNDYSTKFGGSYSRFFLGIDDKNKEWWKKIFNTKYNTITQVSDINTTAFKDTTDSSNPKKLANFEKLKEACKSAYKAQTADVNATGTESGKFKEDEVWKFCSPLGKKPTAITNTEYSSKYGDDGDGKTKYISVKDTDKNDEFWALKNEEFYDESAENQKSGKTAETNGFFKKAYDKKEEVKFICKRAYETNKPATALNTDPKVTEILKYCSIIGS